MAPQNQGPQSSGPRAQAEVAPSSAHTERTSKNSVAYEGKPDFYGSAPGKARNWKALAVGVVGLAILGAMIGAAPSFHHAAAVRDPAGGVAVADPRSIVEFAVDLQKQDKLRQGAAGGQLAPELNYLSPEARAEVARGEREVRFLRVVVPGESGDQIAVNVNGAPAGVLDMSKVGSSVAITYRRGESLSIGEVVVSVSKVPGIHQFNAPDGQTFAIVKSVGQKLEWKGIMP